MKTVNLKSLINLYQENNKEISKGYQKFIGGDYNLAIKKNEIEPLVQLVTNLEEIDIYNDIGKYNGFYIGYQIPQIGKEFDLLKVSEKNILNIEYKREVKELNKIKEQLIKNRYYFKFLNKELTLIGYIQDVDNLYMLQDEDLIEISYSEFLDILRDNIKYENINLNNVFNPSDYLISPFNRTDEFIKGEYFLTQHQREIKNDIIRNIEGNDKHFLIQGDAGTGKTLLMYDLAKELQKLKKRVAIIHCGQLNKGHAELIDKYKWEIYPIKDYKKVIKKGYDVLVIDEIQRIIIKQFDEIINYIIENNKVLICSGDKKQILKEEEEGILEIIEAQIYNKHNLSTKIRTNHQISSWIELMFDMNIKKVECKDMSNINILYFNNISEANNYILSMDDYSFISFTPTLFPENGEAGFEITCKNKNTVGNSHKVIGQEFENVAVIIDRHFYYENKKMKAKNMINNKYSPLDMLYQNVTRAINKLEIIVVGNIDVFNELMDLANRITSGEKIQEESKRVDTNEVEKIEFDEFLEKLIERQKLERCV